MKLTPISILATLILIRGILTITNNFLLEIAYPDSLIFTIIAGLYLFSALGFYMKRLWSILIVLILTLGSIILGSFGFGPNNFTGLLFVVMDIIFLCMIFKYYHTVKWG